MVSLPSIHITVASGSRCWLKLCVLLFVWIAPGMPMVFAQVKSDVAELPGVVVTAPADQQNEPDWIKSEQVLQSRLN